MPQEPPARHSLGERLHRLADKADGGLRSHRTAVRIGVGVLGLALIAVLGAAAWTVMMELRSEHIAAADPRPAYVTRVQEKISKATEAALAGARTRELPASLRLRIEVNAEGELTSARIEQPSGDPELDQLALRIVKTASPFGPFPADMRRTTKIVELNSEFHFH